MQGEGLYFGERQVFVRLFGCNLQCTYCDTRMESFREMDAGEVISAILQFPRGFHRVSFTGGEPLLQAEFLTEVFPLVRQHGLQVYLETNGTLPQELARVVDLVDVVAMDVKLPSSTGQRAFWQEHAQFLSTAKKKDVFVKVVVSLATSQEEILRTIGLIRDSHSAAVLVLQPNSAEDQAAGRSKMEYFRGLCVSEGVAVCIIPQLHKLLGVK